MKHFLSFILVLIAYPAWLNGQNKLQVSGSIRDSSTGESLIGASILIKNTSSGTVTDAEGKYILVTEGGKCTLVFSYIGYQTREIDTVIRTNLNLDILMSQSVTESEAVIVSARNNASNTGSSRTGIVELSPGAIRQLPSLMGEADLIRALNYSPGISTSGDGNSGFYVRGGNVDQNLIMLDNAVVYNPSHVLGFFSVFNSDIVSNATLIKSGIPANYGGRISSVLQVKTIDGDFEKQSVTGTLGLIYSKVTIQGALIKNRLSYLISVRKSYVNEVVKPIADMIIKSDSGGILSGSRFGMYDVNLKLTGKINENNRVSLMFYKGRDVFKLNREDIDFRTNINWGNTLLALNWNHIRSDSSYFMNSLSYSKYDFSYDADQLIMSVNLFSSIDNLNYRLEYNRQTKKSGLFKTGVEAKYYNFVPNRFMLAVNNVDLNYSTYQDLKAGEFAAFLSWEKDLSAAFRISGGLRLNNYRHFGPYIQINRQPGQQDTISYDAFETVRSYSALEPRLSARWQTSPESSVKFSYSRNYQFIHIASASSVTMPSDIWIPSTSHTAPQFGDQVTLGYYRNLFNDRVITSAEAYYKTLSNQVELLYGLGASLQDVSFENSLTSGKGYATGLEFFIQKQQGRISGSLAYALSYSERKFKEINNGNPFPAKYDRRHEINVTAVYKPGKRWEYSVAFIYATGNAMTVPTQMYIFFNNINTVNGPTNGYRMPPYHRMDVSATWFIKKTERFESSLNFSVLNVYNRANPFLIYFDIQGNILQDHSLSIHPRQISIFPLLPSVSWNFKF